MEITTSSWILGIGGFCSSHRLQLRSCISFILTPQFKPLIETAKELAERTDLNPVMIKGNGAEVYVMVYASNIICPNN